MSQLEIFVLGAPSVRWHDVPLTLPGPLSLALLYRLAVQETPVMRAHVGYLFWPQQRPDVVQRAVSQLCTQLRQALPTPSAVRIEPERVSLAHPLVRSDAMEFNRVVRWGVASSQAAPTAVHAGLACVELQRATGSDASRQSADVYHEVNALYRGPLLDGFALADRPMYATWLQDARERWSRHFLFALRTIVYRAVATQDAVTARAAATRFLTINPLDEAIVRCLITLCGIQNDGDSAHQAYVAFEDRLRRHCGQTPMATTVVVHEAVQAGTVTWEMVQSSSGLDSLTKPSLAQRQQLQRSVQLRRHKLLLC